MVSKVADPSLRNDGMISKPMDLVDATGRDDTGVPADPITLICREAEIYLLAEGHNKHPISEKSRSIKIWNNQQQVGAPTLCSQLAPWEGAYRDLPQGYQSRSGQCGRWKVCKVYMKERAYIDLDVRCDRASSGLKCSLTRTAYSIFGVPYRFHDRSSVRCGMQIFAKSIELFHHNPA